MKLSVVVIGDELLSGQITDINSGYVARSLEKWGWEVNKVTIIGDEPSIILRTISSELIDNDIVVTSGGLGPTKDDVTKECLCNLFGGELIRDASVTENIKRIFLNKNKKLNVLTLDQALVPSSCEVLQNEYGTAPIMVFKRDNKILISLPGVPIEFRHCWDDKIMPFLLKELNIENEIFRYNLILSGITESALAILLNNFEESLDSTLHLAYLPKGSHIILRLDGKDIKNNGLNIRFEEALQNLKEIVKEYILNETENDLVKILFKYLKKKHYTVSTAESCTGGKISKMITSVPGSSAFFKGGVVAYSNYVKENVLGVKSSTLQSKGAVSENTVMEMVTGACKIMESDCAIATSGIAGPDGGSDIKPVGTVCIGIKTPLSLSTSVHFFKGSREEIINQSTKEALIQLIDKLRHISD